MSLKCNSLKKGKQIWSTECTTSLILLYENCPCLYDIRSKEYHNRNSRSKALAEITNNMKNLYPNANITVDMIKTKIHGIRTQFMAEINKIKKSEASGASQDDLYIPKLWFYDMLSFLNDSANVVIGGESNMNIIQCPQQSSEEHDLLFDGDISEFSEASSLLHCTSQTSNDILCQPSTSNPTVQSAPRGIDTAQSTPRTTLRAKRKKQEDDQLTKLLEKTTNVIHNMMEDSESSIDPFASYLSSEMKMIEDDEILDCFKENVLLELYKAKKAYRSSMDREGRKNYEI